MYWLTGIGLSLASVRARFASRCLLDGEAEKLTRKAVVLALKGDVACLRLCLDRLVPPRRDRPVHVGAHRAAESGNPYRSYDREQSGDPVRRFSYRAGLC